MGKKKKQKEAPQPQPRRKRWWALGIAAIAVLAVLGVLAVLFMMMPQPRRIIDVHEHIQSIKEVPVLLGAMDAAGIQKTCLMGTSWFTITLNPDFGFTRYDENNEELLKICQQYPGRFEAWPTIKPEDPDALEKFKSLVARGATGLKLYLGHGYINQKTGQYLFHTMAMDDARMLPIYAYCEENHIPVCLHVNPSDVTPGFAEEFIAVLSQFPDMKVVCPHFMLSSIQSSRLEEFLDTFPNLCTDISFGHDDFLKQGIKRISKSPDKFRRIFAKYPDRFFFSTDLVITDYEAKDETWVSQRFQTYLDMLTQKTYTTPVIPNEQLNGLELDPRLLEGILYKNYEAFVAKKPEGTKLTREIDWSRMGAKKTGRQPGETLPPPKKEK